MRQRVDDPRRLGGGLRVVGQQRRQQRVEPLGVLLNVARQIAGPVNPAQALAGALGPDDRGGRDARLGADHPIELVVAERIERFERSEDLRALRLRGGHRRLAGERVVVVLRDAARAGRQRQRREADCCAKRRDFEHLPLLVEPRLSRLKRKLRIGYSLHTPRGGAAERQRGGRRCTWP